MCDRQRLRPASAYAQFDQSLCLSVEHPMSVKILTEHHLEFLSSTGGCTGSSECTLVKMPHCWKSRVAAHIICVLQVTIIEKVFLSTQNIFLMRNKENKIPLRTLI